MHPAYRYRGDLARWEICRVRDGRADLAESVTVLAAGPAKAMERFCRDHDPEKGLYEVQSGIDVADKHGYVPDGQAFRRRVA